ncbi:hypothetical protein N7495_000962 [Penicillium taxi]|uniref:uncharacterized protein n=1 Tax=Penicillium taxi TaxID=168475 RepID=UPI0025450D03|nr:uncharacterized protein N7495_000962 [Penicillium taxi]KAJ5908280.1 hypothetical protein N7495_000962 [Penicillium taxi]
MKAQVTQNTFCTYTGPPEEVDTTIFFISGNPGLISYYHPFLSLLAENLAKASAQENGDAKYGTNPPSFQIYGCSLAGFEVYSKNDKSSVSSADSRNEDSGGSSGPYGLEYQIQFVRERLEALMRENIAADIRAAEETGARPRRRKAILLGHSVGTYMSMEILQHHRNEVVQSEQPGHSRALFDIVGGIMLFPTVKDIAHSPSGQKLTTLVSLIPHLPIIVSLFARLLTFLLPVSVIRFLIRAVMGNSPPHGLETTIKFLKSPGGVRQALHMAADEMRTITADKWTDDVWGLDHQGGHIAKMFFYFGRKDHWVAEKTRDEIVAIRGRKDGLGPRMFVCEEGLPHAFCLSKLFHMIPEIGLKWCANRLVEYSDAMARKVAGMIRDIGRG